MRIIYTIIIGIMFYSNLTYAHETNDPSATQVMDRAVDLLKQSVSGLYEQVSKIAPEVWRMAIKQQYATAIRMIFIPLSITLVIFFILRINKKSKSPDEALTAMCVVFLIGGCIITIVLTSCAIGIFINPKWYAIKDLLDTIKSYR